MEGPLERSDIPEDYSTLNHSHIVMQACVIAGDDRAITEVDFLDIHVDS